LEKFGIPIALGMALSENPQAMYQFAKLDEEKKQEIIKGTQKVKSKEEMRQYVNRLITEYQ